MEARHLKSATRRLLTRVHSSNSAQRIFSDKIEHRKLLLRPSSPPPANARTARRAARDTRCQRNKGTAIKTKRLTVKERKRLRLHHISRGRKEFATFEPLHEMWLGYVHEVLGDELYSAGSLASAKLASAEFVGAEILVVRSFCPSRVGIFGIVIKDSRFTFEIITRSNQTKIIPKEGTVFRLEIPPSLLSDPSHSKRKDLVIDIRGENLRHRPADRANKKFKLHFLDGL